MRIAKPSNYRVVSLIVILAIFFLAGCEAFVRKFTRKKQRVEQEMPVITPEEYKGPQMTKEELYRQYFLYWQSWQEELITSLNDNRSQKKILDCLKEAMKNLNSMREMLVEARQKQLDTHISDMQTLAEQIKNDLYGRGNNNMYRRTAERIKMNIMGNFAYRDIKDDLK